MLPFARSSLWNLRMNGLNDGRLMDLAFLLINYNFISDVFCDLVSCVQFKQREQHLWRSATFRKVAGWNSSSMGVLHVFLNCTNGTKSPNAWHTECNLWFKSTHKATGRTFIVYFVNLSSKWAPMGISNLEYQSRQIYLLIGYRKNKGIENSK